MTIHFFTKGDASVPSSRTRVYYLAEELKRRGYQTTIHSLNASADGGVATRPSFRTFLKYTNTLRLIKKMDTVVLQRTIYDRSFFLAAVVARVFFNRRFFFDIDDAIYLHSKWKTIILTLTASTVICAGEYVATWAKKYNTHVVIIPTGINLSRIKEIIKPIHRSNPEPVIGWVGNGPAHFDNLTFLAPILQRLVRNNIPFRFILIGSYGDKRIEETFAGLGDRLRIIERLAPEDVYQHICQFDIGVMPLRPDPWTHAKYLKTVEYMACEVTPVASRFGENARIIQNGKNGLLALTTDEWYDALLFLIQHPEERKRMSSTASLDASEFDIKRNAERFLAII